MDKYELLKLKHEQWYKQNNCTHCHCPYDCEHPQPFLLMIDNKNIMYCGRCYHTSGELVEMVPCNPEICKD